jgi:hypothetical protein
MRGQRAVALVPRGVRVPEEGAALLHPLHGRALQLHRPPRPPHPPVPRLHGGELVSSFSLHAYLTMTEVDFTCHKPTT